MTAHAAQSSATVVEQPGVSSRGQPVRRGVDPSDLPAPQQAKDEAGFARNVEMVMRIPVSVKVVLGSVSMPVANLVKLTKGAVLPLDRKVGEPVDIVVNGRIVARGEIIMLDDGTSRFGITLTEIVSPVEADKSR